MKNFIVHNSVGKILRTGSCPDDMMDIQAGENEIVMEGIANDVKHRIKKGKIIEYIKTPKDIEKEKEMESQRQEEQKIQNKMQEILRKMAIEEIKKGV